MLNKIKEHINKRKKLILGGAFSLAIVLFFSAIGYFYIWKKVILENGNKKELKVGFVTDWEYGNPKKVGNKLTRIAPLELEKVVNYLNDEFDPQIVISGGDMVESSFGSNERSKAQLKEMNDIFSRLKAKRGYVIGNHDLRRMNKEEVRNILGMQANHEYFDFGDWRFVLMDTNFRTDNTEPGPNRYVDGFVPDKEKEWLREAFDTERPVILFSHHSPMPIIDVDGALYSNLKNLRDGIKFHRFLKEFPNLVLSVAGHDPSFKFDEIDGINYLVVDNLANIDSVGSFGTLKMKYNKYTKNANIKIEHHGPTYKNFEINKTIGEFSLW